MAIFTFIKTFGSLKLTAINQHESKKSKVRVSWDGEFQEDIIVATNDPREAVGIVAEQLLIAK